MNKKQILQKRFDKLEKHYIAIKEYKSLIDDLLEALDDLKYCIDNFEKLQSYYLNSLNFFKKYNL